MKNRPLRAANGMPVLCWVIRRVAAFSAPEGRDMIAQGNALGRGIEDNRGALKGRHRNRSPRISRPFRASTLIAIRFPRALPWAIISRPFGARTVRGQPWAAAAPAPLFSAFGRERHVARVRAYVLAARKRLAEGYEDLRLRHQAGAGVGAGIHPARLTATGRSPLLGMVKFPFASVYATVPAISTFAYGITMSTSGLHSADLGSVVDIP